MTVGAAGLAPLQGAQGFCLPAGRHGPDRHPPARHLAGLAVVECIPEARAASCCNCQCAALPPCTAPCSHRRKAPAAALQGQSHITVEGERLETARDRPASQRARPKLQRFAETPAVLMPAAVPGQDWTQAWQGDTRRPACCSRPSAAPAGAPAAGAAVPEGRSAGDTPQGWHTVAAVEGNGAAAPLTGVSPALAAALAANQQAGPTPRCNGRRAAQAPAGGLMGGLLLNPMPCVFPVLAIQGDGLLPGMANPPAHAAPGRRGLHRGRGAVLQWRWAGCWPRQARWASNWAGAFSPVTRRGALLAGFLR